MHFVICVWLQALEGDALDHSVAIRSKYVQRAVIEAGASVEHPIPVVTIGPRQNVMNLHILEDRTNRGCVDRSLSFNLGALLRSP